MNYLEIDEIVNITDSFEKAKNFLVDKKSELDLKWFIISFHHAVHCLMLYALSNSAGGGVWQESQKKGLPITRSDGTVDIMNKKNRLIDFMKAFEYIQDNTKMNKYIGEPFIAQPYHKDSMWHLNHRLRNEFIHYKPISWNISEQYIYEVCEPILDIVEFLIFDSGQCHLLEEDNNKLRKIVNDIKQYLHHATISSK